MKLALVEVFYSVQGEGYHAGRSAVFVRFAGCPLACEFAPGIVCDTPYQKANLFPTLDELFNDIVPTLHPLGGLAAWKQENPAAVPMMIFTGGEPTTAPLFDLAVQGANALGFYTACETNGTRYRDALQRLDWMSVSPKDMVPQTSRSPLHNHNPQSPALDLDVIKEANRRRLGVPLEDQPAVGGAEFRYVIGGATSPVPVFYPATAHYVSPAVRSDGSGEEWKTGWPGFAPGALDRCLEIVRQDSRWKVSVQVHKVMGVR